MNHGVARRRGPILLALARRSVRRTLRQRRLLALPVLFPLLLFAINSSALSAATEIEGFPPVSYADFAFAVTFLLGGMLAAVAIGTDFAGDLESGFLRRLSLSSVGLGAIVAGQLSALLVFAVAEAVLFVAAGLVAGISVAAGVAGVAVLLALALVVACAFGAIGILIAAWTGSGAAVQGLFPLLFVSVFFSSAFLPRELISVGWFRAVADVNPVSYLVEGIRSLVVTGWDGEALGLGFGLAGLIAIAALFGARAGLRRQAAA